MYLLSDFFIATQEEAEQLDVEQSPVLSLPTVLARGVGFNELMSLDLIIFGLHSREPLFSPRTPPIRPEQRLTTLVLREYPRAFA